MRVTGIKASVVNAEMRNWVFVKVQTDVDGLFGWGEATLEWKTRAVVGAVEDLAPLIIGRDPLDIEQAVRAMRKMSFWKMGAIGMSAASGIELALWDIFGKHLGLPVWRLLGGKVRDRVSVYTHLGMGEMSAVYDSMDAQSVVDRALAVVEKGYRAMKVVFVPYTHYHAPVASIDKLDPPAPQSSAYRPGRRRQKLVGLRPRAQGLPRGLFRRVPPRPQALCRSCPGARRRPISEAPQGLGQNRPADPR